MDVSKSVLRIFHHPVDGYHPNDLGFYRFYRTLLPVLEQALNT